MDVGVKVEPSGVKSCILQTRVIGRMRKITPGRCSELSLDASSAQKPGAANRAFEVLLAMLQAARQWGDIGEQVPDACANIVKNPRPVVRYLDRMELERLGAVLDRRQDGHSWPVAAIRLLPRSGKSLRIRKPQMGRSRSTRRAHY